MDWALLENSFWVSGLATLCALAVGGGAALFARALSPGWRRVLLAAATAALVWPSFLATNCWQRLLGVEGLWRRWLPFNIYSLGGAVWVLTLLTWPIALWMILSAWQNLDQALLESDPAVSGAALVRRVLLPMGRPAMGLAAVIIFVLALNNFAVPSVLQVKVFPAELWLRFSTTYQYGEAVRLAWPLILGPFLLVWWFSRRPFAWPNVQGTATAPAFRRQLGGPWFWASAVVALAALTFSLLIPLVQIAVEGRTWTELPGAVAAGWPAIWNSIFYAASTAVAVIGLGLVLRRWRWGIWLWALFLAPGILLGIGLIFVFNRPLFSGFYDTAGLVILALVMRYAALGWTGVSQSMRQVDPDLLDVARLYGASRWRRFRHVYWPQIALPVAAVGYLVYLLALWDVETLVLILPPGGQTVASRVFNFLHYGHSAQVNALCLLLLCLAIGPLLIWVLARWGPRVGLRLRSGRVFSWAIVGVAAAGILAGCRAKPSALEAPVHSRFFDQVQVLGRRGRGVGEFIQPRSVLVDGKDNLYVVDSTGRVQKFSAKGVFLTLWQMPDVTIRRDPKGMCVDGDGNIVILEPHVPRVIHYKPDGRMVASWGRVGTNNGEIYFPRAVVANAKGDLFISEYGAVERIQEFSPYGKRFIRSFGRPGNGPGELNRAEGLAMDRQGRIYEADSCNHRIQIFSQQGKFLGMYGKPGTGFGQLSYPYDIKVDADGWQFVCEYGNSRVQIFDPRGRPVEILGGAGMAPGRFNNPWALALDSKGDLYVADTGNNRVEKFIRKRPLKPNRPVGRRADSPHGRARVSSASTSDRARRGKEVPSA